MPLRKTSVYEVNRKRSLPQPKLPKLLLQAVSWGSLCAVCTSTPWLACMVCTAKKFIPRLGHGWLFNRSFVSWSLPWRAPLSTVWCSQRNEERTPKESCRPAWEMESLYHRLVFQLLISRQRRLWKAAWPSGQRVVLAIRRSRVRVALWPLAGFVLCRPEFKSSATLVNRLPVGVLNPVMLYLSYVFSKYLLILKRFGH